MKELYATLARAFENKVYQITENTNVTFKDLSHFVAMKGKYYDTQNCRLLLVGRAVNGWESLSSENAENFGLHAERAFLETGFQWIKDDNMGLHNLPAKDEKTYYLSKSPFWRTAKEIWKQLSGNTQTRWIDYIAWSNIYKIAPPVTGNPTTDM